MNPFILVYKTYYNHFPKLGGRIKGAHRFRIWLAKLATLGAKKYPYPDKTVLDYNWDYLIAIDACRYDLYKEVFGESAYIISNGSHTAEWSNRTFNSNHDIIYISGNPMMSKARIKKDLGNIPFYHLEKVYDYGWDKKLKTVKPEEVTKAALKCYEKWPNKRMIIHYMQPHRPFVGKKSLRGEDDVWGLLSKGELNKEKVWEAYKSNLKLVMREVKKLGQELKGKVVLTSDHGNCMGEYGIYDHLAEIRIEELVKVPWVILKNTSKAKGELKNIEI